jgi:hypothetical protein
VETRRRSTAAVIVPRVPPQCAHRRRAAAGRQGGVAGVVEGIGARDARYVAAARRGRDRGAGAARLSADRGVGWPGGDWGVEGVRLGLCHWAGLGLRWEQKTKQVNIMHITIDDQLVSSVQLGTVQTATVLWCTGNFPMVNKKLSTGIQETFY